MSIQRDIFESEIRKPAPDWNNAISNLSALAMFEMLPTLRGLAPPLLTTVRSQAWQLLRIQLGWSDSYNRIDFAADVVTDQKFAQTDTRVPADQIEDATDFLISLLRPASSKAAHGHFVSAEDAAVAALQEIIPISRAVGLEFAGSIYSKSGSFSFTAPERGGTNSSNPWVAVPAGTTAVARYHAHPPVGTNFENFSIEDIGISKGIPSDINVPPRVTYLGTPSGRIKKWIPPSLLPSQEQASNFLGKQVSVR
jgi:hypothetical protein